MGRSQPASADARRAADRLREATNLLGGAQQQNSSGRLDAMSHEADRLAEEEKAQAQKLGQMPSGQQQNFRGRFGQQLGSDSQGNSQDVQKLAEERQRLADDLARLQKQMRDAQRDLASNQRPAASKLRDALGDLDSNDVENRIQRSADSLHLYGANSNSPQTEQQIDSSLQSLSDQMRQAQQALGGDQQGADTALDRIERLRSQLQAMDPGARNGQTGQRGQQGQNGQGNQSGQGNQAGQGNNQGNQGNQGNHGNQGNQGGQGNRGGNNQAGGAAYGYNNRGGYGATYGGGDRGGYRNYGGYDTGNNSELPQPVAPITAMNPADLQRNIQQNVEDLGRLRQQLQDDPEAARQVDSLIQEMQRLDPRRFPGNPALVEQLHTQVLNDVDKLELQLRRQADDKSGQIRSSDSAPVPSGYQDAVADYFRRLSNTH